MTKEEKLEEAKRLYKTSNADQKYVLERLFPELKESEDERIRKEMIEILEKEAHDFPSSVIAEKSKSWIAWLEKQGGQKSADKVEPKFHEGDWVVDEDNNCVYQIERVIENVTSGKFSYDLMEGGYFPSTKKNYHLWTIQDAKDGDVLVASDGSIFLFKGTTDCACKHYAALTTDGIIKFNEGLEHYWETSTAVHLATKEQRDLLFQNMKEAGYEWNADKKELKKIEQKPAWSEEDEETLNYIIAYIEKNKNEDLIYTKRTEVLEGMVDFLKSLKDRYAWKPSEEQMDALWSATEKYLESDNENVRKLIGEVLESLYENLKKLREDKL